MLLKLSGLGRRWGLQIKIELSGVGKTIGLDASKALKTGVTQHGTKFNQIISVTGANGRVINVLTGWIKTMIMWFGWLLLFRRDRKYYDRDV